MLARVAPPAGPFTPPQPSDGPGEVAGLMPSAAQDPAALEEALGLDRSGRREIQRRLGLAGFSPGGADGIFGARTREAISRWQADRGLPGTGYLDAGQFGLLKDETDGAYQPLATTPARPVKAASVQPSPAAPAPEGRTGRYLDTTGCLRDPDGSAVPFFKPGCR